VTIAICIQCGTRKFGAFSPCAKCGFTPTASAEQAKSVLLSDHHHTRDELDQLGRTIQSGHPIVYDATALALNERVFECMDEDPDAFQCKICGEDVDWFSETLCRKCKEKRPPKPGGKPKE
jgi:ribosomal protein L40E